MDVQPKYILLVFSFIIFLLREGSGKKTRVLALLKEIFGSGVERMKLEHR